MTGGKNRVQGGDSGWASVRRLADWENVTAYECMYAQEGRVVNTVNTGDDGLQTTKLRVRQYGT